MTFLAVIIVPISSTTNIILQRQMISLNDYTAGAYLSFAMTIFYVPLVYLIGDGLDILKNFSLSDWFLISIIGSIGCIGKILRFKALQFEEPGKLSGLTYLQNIIQFLMDLMFLHISFSYLQFVGLALILGLNGAKISLWLMKNFTKKDPSRVRGI